MEINYVFPHAIATVDMNALVDNKKIHDTIEEHAIGVPEETGARVWDCKVKTSFENDELSMKFAVEHVDFLKAVNEQVNQYMVEVGWYEPGKPNKVTHVGGISMMKVITFKKHIITVYTKSVQFTM